MALAVDATTEIIGESAHRLTGSNRDYDPLLEMIGDARFVLLGEASHGTHEFYRERAQITKRLIQEKGFTSIAVEADWPDAYRVNRFIRNESEDEDAEEALQDFKRFPTWMWRNADVLDFVGWLRDYNDNILEPTQKVGFYGLDLYSLHSSIQAVLDYLKKTDPEEARRARSRYSCFEHFGEDPQSYAFAATTSNANSCEEEVIRQLVELRRRSEDYLRAEGKSVADEFFFAEQNARLVKNAEHYYRSMFYGRQSSWNLRDQHMADTLDSLMGHLQRHRVPQKIAVWEHNSHLGDARATQMGERGELNVGQLIRERHSGQSVLVGFTTYSGSVTAASEWDTPAERKRVRDSLPESYEALFHEVGFDRFFLNMRDIPAVKEKLQEPRLERAIGVIYMPQTERMSHYFEAYLSDQFDAILHFDQTRAVEPLERTVEWRKGDIPETFPFSV
ncbi:MAG: erythromycin esterase family protein [Verrucomicrobia bacterium]|nr:erythromycin esterase family protein [Verrucomicrobiota bacterium]